ncbi:MAG TPA: ABC transporter permease [Longimicrobiales bacterium]|nr:ABC transporter permease [Longimicrobiales bacterium]
MTGVVWAVIKREYLQRVRTKWFVIATVAGPVLLMALMLIPYVVSSRGADRDRTLAVMDETGVLFEGVAPRLEEAGFTVERAGTGPEERVRLEEALTEGHMGGYLVLDQGTLARGEIRYFAREAPSPLRRVSLRQAVIQSALEVRLGGNSADVDALLSGGSLDVDLLTGEGIRADDPKFVAAYVGAFLLYMVVLFYAVAVMRSVLEEKTSRIVEVVISSMRPFELMLGKILGVGAVGLTQMAVWVVAAVLIFTLGLPALAAARPEAFSPEFLAEAIPGVGYAVLMVTFFLGGYFIYSGLYAAVGATCNTDEEAQQAQFPVIMLLVVPIIFVTQVIQEPNSTMAMVLSFVPFFTPILMFARAVVGGATLLEVGVSVILMAGTVLAVAWLAGRIYKVGILMSGKRPTLPEIVRWVREA